MAGFGLGPDYLRGPNRNIRQVDRQVDGLLASRHLVKP